jgi:hypothetical protein
MYSVLRSAKVGIGPNKNRSKLMTVCKIVVKPVAPGNWQNHCISIKKACFCAVLEWRVK